MGALKFMQLMQEPQRPNRYWSEFALMAFVEMQCELEQACISTLSKYANLFERPPPRFVRNASLNLATQSTIADCAYGNQTAAYQLNGGRL
jgi:hypothetical protein